MKRFPRLGGLAILTIMLLFQGRMLAQESPIETAIAYQNFQEAQALCNRDNGKLWGVSLCGPMLFVDRATRTVVANQADPQRLLTRSGNVFIGTLPQTVQIANTAIDWAGVKWTMMIFPLPENKYHRANLMAHELWHRIQNDLGFPGSGVANNHLDTRDGRLWLQLEWRALESALITRGKKRRQAITDALVFRAYRRMLFPHAASEEREMEMHEGLAEYTGVKLSGSPNVKQYVVEKDLKPAVKRETFVRSFAYASGPAYGILLDGTGKSWRKSLKKEDDLGTLLQKTLAVKLPQDIRRAADERAAIYDGDKLQASETDRENRRKALVAAYRAKLVEGPVLVIPLQKMSMELNPGTLLPLESLGTVYPTIRVVDVWGILTVSKGALINSTYSRVYVSAPLSLTGSPIQGDGWTLELSAGWTVVPGERQGDFILHKVNND